MISFLPMTNHYMEDVLKFNYTNRSGRISNGDHCFNFIQKALCFQNNKYLLCILNKEG